MLIFSEKKDAYSFEFKLTHLTHDKMAIYT